MVAAVYAENYWWWYNEKYSWNIPTWTHFMCTGGGGMSLKKVLKNYWGSWLPILKPPGQVRISFSEQVGWKGMHLVTQQQYLLNLVPFDDKNLTAMAIWWMTRDIGDSPWNREYEGSLQLSRSAPPAVAVALRILAITARLVLTGNTARASSPKRTRAFLSLVGDRPECWQYEQAPLIGRQSEDHRLSYPEFIQ